MESWGGTVYHLKMFMGILHRKSNSTSMHLFERPGAQGTGPNKSILAPDAIRDSSELVCRATAPHMVNILKTSKKLARK